MRNKRILPILFILAFNFVCAQEYVLSKEAMVQFALENNFGIKVAKNQVKIADNNSSLMNSGYLPTLYAR